MTVAISRVNDVYSRLASILHRPEAFGLGATAPPALTKAIEGMLRTLGNAMVENEELDSEGDLEQELSQDADQFCLHS